MSKILAALAVVALASCGTKDAPPEPAHVSGAMPVRVGDCAPLTVAFVAGPRPQRFDPADADPDADALAKRRATGSAEPGGSPLEGVPTPSTFAPQLPDSSPTAGAIVQAPYDTVALADGGIAAPAAGSDSAFGTLIGSNSAFGAPPGSSTRLDKAIIRRYVKRNIDKIRYCYERELLSNPDLRGQVMVHFAIGRTGAVMAASASGVSPKVAACVGHAIESIQFPPPRGGGIVQVNYPFNFRPAGTPLDAVGGNPMAGLTGATIGSGNGSGNDAPPPPSPPPPPPVARHVGLPPPASMHHAHELFADADGVDEHYRPAGDLDAPELRLALADCFRWNADRATGNAVVDLLPSGAQVHGVDDPHVRDCVAAVAAKAAPRAKAPERCAIAWGTAPIASLPAIELDGAKLAFGGAPLATGDGDTAQPFPALVAALTRRRAAALGSDAPELTEHEPLILRATDATPMKQVWRAIDSALAAGDDVVLARTGAAQTAPPVAFPSVPVPFATGVPWNRLERRVASVPPADRVELAIYATATGIFVGISQVSDFQQADRGPEQLAKLDQILRDTKSNALFVDRDDAQIGAADDARFGDFMAAIEAAQQAGFAHWRIADRAQLAALPPSALR